jgi:hypothetical protein
VGKGQEGEDAITKTTFDELRQADNEQISGSNEHAYLDLTVQNTVEALDTSFGRPCRPPTPCWQESKNFRIRGNAPITKAYIPGRVLIITNALA